LPGRVNALCDRALSFAGTNGRALIDASFIDAAVEDVQHAPLPAPLRTHVAFVSVVVLMALAGAGLAVLVFRPQF
jgi:hypothetical protein